VRVAHARTAHPPPATSPSPVDVVRKLGGQCSDSTIATTMNRMRRGRSEETSWTAASVRELRLRLGIEDFDPAADRPATVSLQEAARRLEIGMDSVLRLIRAGVLPATQLLPFAPWQIPSAALDSEVVRAAAHLVKTRRPLNCAALEDRKTLRLPGF